jgi:hypothetical protein
MFVIVSSRKLVGSSIEQVLYEYAASEPVTQASRGLHARTNAAIPSLLAMRISAIGLTERT